MKVSITLPSETDIMTRRIPVPIARRGYSWNKGSLGAFADQSGVYIHTVNDAIVYVGKTTRGTYGTFGERLRRECQKKAAKDSFLYRQLVRQKLIESSFIPLFEIRKRIQPSGLADEDLALLFERSLIALFKPKWNRDVKR